MKKGFEELDVWKNAFELAKDMGKIFYDKEFRNRGFQDQIMRAVISISNNIAEGNDRGSAKDFMKFLFISKGSCAEVRSMLYLAHEYGYISKDQSDDFLERSIIISQQLGKFISYLDKKIS